MKKRFDLDFEVLDKKRAVQFLARFEEEGEATQLKGILSLQTLRGRELQDRWEAVAPTFNLVIFDEAGRLRNPETLSWDFGDFRDTTYIVDIEEISFRMNNLPILSARIPPSPPHHLESITYSRYQPTSGCPEGLSRRDKLLVFAIHDFLQPYSLTKISGHQEIIAGKERLQILR